MILQFQSDNKIKTDNKNNYSGFNTSCRIYYQQNNLSEKLNPAVFLVYYDHQK